MAIKRLHYFNGLFMKEADFTDEQEYHLEMRRRHNRHLHRAGIAHGLGVTPGVNQVTVDAGLAIDSQGREIVLEAPQVLTINDTGVIGVSYREEMTDVAEETEFAKEKRWTESPDFTRTEGPDVVVLARVSEIAADGTVKLDPAFRPTYSGPAVLGDLTVGHDLTVNGNLTVQGTTTTVSTERMQGNVELGNEDGDTVTVKGSLRTGHSSGRLQIDAATDVKGNLSVTGAAAIQGHVTLGNANTDQVTIEGALRTGHSSGKLQVQSGMDLAGPLSITAAGTTLDVSHDAVVKGKLGVGTAAPEATLHVDGGNWNVTSTEGDLKVGDANFRVKIGIAKGGGGAGDVRIRAQGGTNRMMLGGGTSDDLTIQNGKVGVGTITPGETLDVNGRVQAGKATIGPWPANAAYAFFGTNGLPQNDAKNYALLQDAAGSDAGRTYLNSPVDIRFRIGNADKMILANNGHLSVTGDLTAGNMFGGGGFRIAAGETPQDNTNWQVYSANGIYVDVDTSRAGFTQTPLYLASLGGSSNHWAAVGVSSIYSPTSKKFRVYVRWADGNALTPAQAKSMKWHVQWLGVQIAPQFVVLPIGVALGTSIIGRIG